MKYKFITISALLIFVFLFSIQAQASGLSDLVNSELDTVQEGITGSTTAASLENIIINIVHTVLGFLGLIFVVLMIWSGYQWMTSGGNTTAIETAKKRIINAVIGLAIVLAAYSITEFLVIQVLNAVN
ncbi:hypothetical protein ISR92_01395 [Patescibacteria group bacterium]|nr:hypothetical protein [Patescibacteria group bacterium]